MDITTMPIPYLWQEAQRLTIQQVLSSIMGKLHLVAAHHCELSRDKRQGLGFGGLGEQDLHIMERAMCDVNDQLANTMCDMECNHHTTTLCGMQHACNISMHHAWQGRQEPQTGLSR